MQTTETSRTPEQLTRNSNASEWWALSQENVAGDTEEMSHGHYMLRDVSVAASRESFTTGDVIIALSDSIVWKQQENEVSSVITSEDRVPSEGLS